MLKLYVQTQLLLAELINRSNEEEGVETLEWLGMILVVMALLGTVAGFLGQQGNTDNIAQAFTSTVSSWINALAGS